ncbi:hypothetical protein ACFIOY_19435 [Bradyrhizobium sp. TZ2]
MQSKGVSTPFVGSDERAFPAAAGILAAFCENIIHVGANRPGHKLKLVYNSMTMGIVAAAAETCQIADGLGVALATLRSLVSRRETNSGIFQNFAGFLLGEKLDFFAISITNAAKDIVSGD